MASGEDPTCLTCEVSGEDVSLQELDKSIDELSMVGILNFMIVNLFCAILLLHEDFNIISRFKAKVCKHIKLMMCIFYR